MRLKLVPGPFWVYLKVVAKRVGAFSLCPTLWLLQTPGDYMKSRDAGRIDREISHWDAVAAAEAEYAAQDLVVRPADLHDRLKPWLEYLDLPAITAHVLHQLGDLEGRTILDLGTGNGFLGVALALRGAKVVAVDISPASLELARRRAELSGVADRINFRLAPAEDTGLADASCDAACGLFVLHHTNLDASSREIGRVLRPGAPAAFVETLAFNPILSAARAALTGRFGIEKASSDDEAPISRAGIARLCAGFPGRVAVEMPAIVCFRMLCYVPALQGARPAAVLLGVDRALGRVPGLGWLSYFGVVSMRRH
jgi:SAM-dependent methyltransferase